MEETPATAETVAEKLAKKESKRKNKIRSAWISFVGRVVAQIVGAVATITLGLMIADHIHRTPAQQATVTRPEAVPPLRVNDGRVSIAVLPFQNLSGDAGQVHIADGMTEALIADLARVRTLRVISRTSVMPYKASPKSLPTIAHELGADVLVEGSVLRDGPRLRVIAQLIEAKSDRHLWAESYDREARDILALQADVVRRIAEQVSGVSLSFQSSVSSLQLRTDNGQLVTGN
jgi:TolB-like protein